MSSLLSLVLSRLAYFGPSYWTGPRAGAAAMAVRACSACLHVEKKMCTVLFVQHYLLCINALL